MEQNILPKFKPIFLQTLLFDIKEINLHVFITPHFEAHCKSVKKLIKLYPEKIKGELY